MERRKLILVDMHDQPIGEGEKLEVHTQGRLHRAFSLFLVNGQGQLLLQRRAMGKYHSGGLWTNSCCSHPAPGAELLDFAILRAWEELGVRVEDLRELGSFVYYRDFGNGLKEFELDHVLAGRTEETVHLNPEEAMEYSWVDVPWALEDLRLNPESYTAWYPSALSLALPGILGM